MLISLALLIGAAVTAHGEKLWECDTFPSSDPLGGCDWDRTHIHWEESNLAAVDNPSGGDGPVLRVLYKQGSWVTNDNNKGGIQFYASPFTAGNKRRFEYDIYFSSNFDFVKGGKLPGFFGGSGSCSGGGDDQTCFSTRYMWRTSGDGEIYGYIPNETDDWFCDHSDVYCNFDYGHSFGRGSWRMSTGRWYTLSQTIQLNNVGSKDGYMLVEVDGQEVYRIEGLVFRSTSSLQIDQIYFSTFFGGSDSTWQSSRDVYTYYRKLQVHD